MNDATPISEEDREMLTQLSDRIWGSPDNIDSVLIQTMQDLRHERRMKEIRTLDLEEWAREVKDS